ncbi:hypothetical protein [Pseudomonas asplenii]|uniref:hypothetical protein n=1 Tax=Pseudomonas asplenii TaxID=53407 RepID=UPI00223482E9|nr:hypothetical protein [Pseudomonas asplenii]UZE28457.1 hypothetical protein LOY63_24600 [Pseudomonas asplenii]
MFDDYAYKNTTTRVRVKFTQKHDEPMYPWEIASFLAKFNTVYYKFELLNSICSALKEGIQPEDIFIFDHSLPLYERYSEMNLLSEPLAAKLFYPIGKPIPLAPSKWVYEYNCLYCFFQEVNSFLKRNHFQPLRLVNVSAAYEEFQIFGLDEAEGIIKKTALQQAERSCEAAVKRGEEKNKISLEDIDKSLSKYVKYKEQTFSNLDLFKGLSEEERINLLTLDDRKSRRLNRYVNSFFETFEQTVRPLVCARVGENKFRVLGRSLINKREQTGLELKEIKKNSPLGAFFEGGIALFQAIRQEARSKELHEYDKEIKQTELEISKAKLEGEKIKNISLELKLAQDFEKISRESDISAVRSLPQTVVTLQLIKAYGQQQSHAAGVLHNQDLTLSHGETRIIDELI